MASKKDKRNKHKDSAELARRRAQKHSGSGSSKINIPDGISMFRPKASDKAFRLDILQYRVGKGNPEADEGMLHYERTFWAHRIGIDNIAYVCPLKTNGDACPVCELINKLKKQGADKEITDAIKSKERQLFNVIDLRDKEKGIQIFEHSYHQFGKVLDTKINNEDDDDNYSSFAHHEDGQTLKVVFKDHGYGPEAVDIEFKPRSEQYDEDEMLKKVQSEKVPYENI